MKTTMLERSLDAHTRALASGEYSAEELKKHLGNALFGIAAVSENASLDAEFELTKSTENFIKSYSEE